MTENEIKKTKKETFLESRQAKWALFWLVLAVIEYKYLGFGYWLSLVFILWEYLEYKFKK
jgi:hypothetical protein